MRRFLGIALALVLVGGLLSATSSAQGANGVSVSYETTNSWNNGVQAAVTLEGTGTALTGWELSFDYPHEIGDIWNAQIVAHTGDSYTLRGMSYNADVPGNGSVDLGWVASHGGNVVAPTNCSLNGVECSFDGAPPPPTTAPPTTAPPTTAPPTTNPPPAGFDRAVPFSTNGGDVVDADGDVFVFQGVNWFGVETGSHVVHGLWTRDYKSMLAQIASLGYNTIRLPFSIEAVQSTTPVSVNSSNGKNAELVGRTPLEAMEIVVAEAAEHNLLVMLDNHSLADDSHTYGLWYSDQYPEADWIANWELLAQRFGDDPNVMGADLKNEPHGAASWGTGDQNDWRLAAERAGNAVQAIAPHWLIVVEGVEGPIPGQQLSGHWWGGNLEGVRANPVRLDISNKLVYSPHEYGPGVWEQPWFSPYDPAVLLDRWETGFAYIAEDGIAPILVGEFGGREVGTDTTEGKWQNQFVDFLAERGYSWTYWSWNPNSGDTGGILQDDWTNIHADKQAMLDRALDADPSDPPPPPTTAPPTTAPPTTAPPTTAPPTTAPPTTAPPTTAPPIGDVRAEVEVESQWPDGYCTGIRVHNDSSDPVVVTTLTFTLPASTPITSSWNGQISRTGDSVGVVLPPWVLFSPIGPGTSQKHIGFCATGSTLPIDPAAE